jgi:hypothetical protein
MSLKALSLDVLQEYLLSLYANVSVMTVVEVSAVGYS